jgi:hypothetical protein
MTVLRLIAGEAVPFDDDGAPMLLGPRSRRPGLAHEDVALDLDQALAERCAGAAALEGLPTPLWAVIAIESERALRLTCADTDLAAAATRLHALARTGRHGSAEGTRLGAWAAALRLAHRTSPEVDRPLRLLVPYHTLLSWRSAASDAELGLQEWAIRILADPPSGRGPWEAAAAEQASTLAEWIALHRA